MNGGEVAAFVVPSDVSEPVKALFADAEAQRWRFELFQERRQRARYWCPCGGHEVWIELYPKTADFVDRLRGHLHTTTCWEEGT